MSKYKLNFLIYSFMVFFIISIAACTGETIIKGQVTGFIYDTQGNPVKEGTYVFIGPEFDDSETDLKLTIRTDFQTNEKGEFTLENIPEGKYSLYMTGIDISNVLSLGVGYRKGKPIVFQMSPDVGIDLGKIEYKALGE